MSVVFFRRLGVLEHNARCYRIGSLYVGVVEALDMHWQFVHHKVGFQGFQFAQSVLFWVFAFHLLVLFEHIELCVAVCQFKDFSLVAFLRVLELYVFNREVNLER